jgi:hypothetical protein
MMSMSERLDANRITLPVLTIKTVVVHTVTYFVAGILAYTLNDYQQAYSQPPLSYLMRPTSDALVMAGPLFQPIRGVIFALAFHPLRSVLFEKQRGWLTLWWLLLALGVLSTFGPAFGSVEGLIYTTIPPRAQLLGLWEVVLQSFLLSFILFHWVTKPRNRWLRWSLYAAFCIVLLLPVLGLLTTRR